MDNFVRLLRTLVDTVENTLYLPAVLTKSGSNITIFPLRKRLLLSTSSPVCPQILIGTK